ncbi:MAG: hypothetical protein NZ992_02740, partial [Candidatus Korarchaeum sp.]|nr:hypothetical protein [Candidatus Korarchaeum sp.]
MKLKLIILLLLILPAHLCSAQSNLSLSVDPSELVASPGDRVRVRILMKNEGSSEVNLTGFELKVVQHFPLLPSGVQVGVYEMPLEEPVRLKPGEEREISRVFEVPSVAYSGEFSVFLKARSTAGESVAEVKVSLGLTLSSALPTALAISLEAGVIYGIYRALRRRLKPEHPARRRLRRLRTVRGWREYDKEVVELMNERKSWGIYENGERYERHVRAIKKADELISAVISDLREEEKRIEREIAIMSEELSELRGKLSERSL